MYIETILRVQAKYRRSGVCGCMDLRVTVQIWSSVGGVDVTLG